VFLVAPIGDETYSKNRANIFSYVFYAQFFNTGFIVPLVNANLTEHEPKQFTQYFNGPFYDYTPQWYIDVGLKICITMTLLTQVPMLSYGIVCLIKYCKQRYDSKGTMDPYVTRSHTMGWYKFFRGGSHYMISFKYSDSLNVTFIACLYGLSMPILFPIASLALFNQRLFERI